MFGPGGSRAQSIRGLACKLDKPGENAYGDGLYNEGKRLVLLNYCREVVLAVASTTYWSVSRALRLWTGRVEWDG